MSLEQYKNKNRGELWDVVVIQAEVIAELEKERDDLQECFDTCYDELGATRDAHDELEKDLREFEHAVRNENELLEMQKNQDIRDLEQQAKGLTDYAKEQEQGLNAVWMIAAASKLIDQAKALQEQGDEAL